MAFEFPAFVSCDFGKMAAERIVYQYRLFRTFGLVSYSETNRVQNEGVR